MLETQHPPLRVNKLTTRTVILGLRDEVSSSRPWYLGVVIAQDAVEVPASCPLGGGLLAKQEASDGAEQNATRMGSPSMSRWCELCRHEVEVGQDTASDMLA